MTVTQSGIGIGQKVPDFQMTYFDPVKSSFEKIDLESLKSQNKWTILFFYPADFTFV